MNGIVSVFYLALFALVGGCSLYGSGSQAECNTLADCNPGKECGTLIRCVDGKCDPNLTTDLPCQQTCTQDSDCPSDMHCRIQPDDKNECVADGTCLDVSECQGLPHDDCRGAFECKSGRCEYTCSDMTSCKIDSECVKVPADCCGCELAGGEAAVNVDSRQAYLDELNAMCAMIDIKCEQYDTCTDWPAVCDGGHCKTLSEKCGCGDDWDPVCSGTGAAWATFGSPCEAECVDRDWYYHGRCECQMFCDGGPCMRGVCATNGATYYCGEAEAECNGQQVWYPGSCNHDCEMCMMLGRPSIPACDQDFCDQQDICFAECHDLDWWHEGRCLAGEGNMCAGYGGPPCESDDLFCLMKDDFPDAAGVCIALGHCLEAAHCERQPLDHIECVGSWFCQNHACEWICVP